MLNVFPQPAEQICRYVEILHEESFPAIEVLARPLDEALDMIRQINDSPQRKLLYLGVGTITTADAARRAVALEPDFVVSPAFSSRVLDIVAESGIPYIPAVRTFQDVQDILDAFEDKGLNVELLKFCPVMGLTPEYLRSLGGCYPGILFCPTCTITLESLPEWKKVPCAAGVDY